MPNNSQSSGGLPARSASANGSARRSRRGEARASEPGAERGPTPVHLSELYRGYPRLGLIRDLAFGEFSHAEIAETLGLYARDIALFADEHVEEIAEVRAALAGQLAIETAGLWISKRQNRLAEYQADVEDLKDVVEFLRKRGVLGSKSHHEVLKTKVAILKAVADELDPPRRGMAQARGVTSDDQKVVHYVIEDPDIEAMT